MLAHLWAEHQSQILGQVEQIHVGVGDSISQHLLGTMHQVYLEIPETHRNIFRLLGRCWHTNGWSIGTWKLGQFEQIHRGVGKSISQHLLGPMHQTSLEIPETHRNIFRLLGRCWHTNGWSIGTWKLGQFEQIHGEWGSQYLSIY